MVFRVFVERRRGCDIEASGMKSDLIRNLLIRGITSVRVINRYDVEGISAEAFEAVKYTVFSEPQTDMTYGTLSYEDGSRLFAVEYLPGQYDQRADSCSQCIQITTLGERPTVRTAKIYIIGGDISDAEFDRIKHYVINPVESREASFALPETLDLDHAAPASVPVMEGFRTLDEEGLASFIGQYALAMDQDDIRFCRDYFANTEKRDPTMSEIRLIDSYWSDHCRHTTFLTAIDEVKIGNEYIKETFEDYLAKREIVYGAREKNVSLMDMGTLAAKYLRKTGVLRNLDESEEINACSVKIKVLHDGNEEDWLLMFKNETHNHPTEIEPFGGAATCLGGAIRDPLSGRAYVYQAMRVTGAGDPRVPVGETLPGKLPQSKLTTGAANGYSSYGNQIGLATGGVFELYHPGYVAKRLEIGAVVGAAPIENVIREVPEAGDVIILLGGRTGRDGCGGATGSSKAHTAESLVTCGAEVQKGNPPEERKLQRLFRDPEVTRLIKRCNDFGAGGVSVAIGELADGLEIDLSRVPKKYEGLDGTELAISESQERMAVVIRAEDEARFIQLANRENLEATPVARVTAEPRLKMLWNGQTTVDLTREFLNSNGAPKHTDIDITRVERGDILNGLSDKLAAMPVKDALLALMGDLNVCSQKGLVERFDASIGASTVTMPYGGKYQLTQPQYMAAKIPVLKGETDTSSLMAYGFNPCLSEKSPYHGALLAVVESVSKLVAAGVSYDTVYLTFQEYFERTKNDPARWGKPAAALLGAFKAQCELGIAAIGGKDSMSGSFEQMDVPPTLVSFAVGVMEAGDIVTPEFKCAGSKVYYFAPRYTSDQLPDFDSLKAVFGKITSLIADNLVRSVYTLGFGGIAEGLIKMAFGNGIGFAYEGELSIADLTKNCYGAFIVETNENLDGTLLGYTTDAAEIRLGGEVIPLADLEEAWKAPLEQVFPTKAAGIGCDRIETFTCTERSAVVAGAKFAKPRIVIPVFPGTNCEYDTMRSFDRAGGDPSVFVLRNLNQLMLDESIDEFASLIDQSQIFMLPGGFSGGDEPDGSGKFITAVLRSPKIKEAVTRLIEERDGLVLGICNGFQALIKSGLLPYGRIMDEMTPDCPTLTFNSIKRHQSMMVTTRIATVKSPWLAGVHTGDLHTIAISHGEGRFRASEALIRELAANGQIATQYVDLNGNPTMDIRYNPNASDYAIEGIISPDGRIFGKMGHSERIGSNVAKNVPGNKDQLLFKSGVDYFKL